MRQTLFAFLLWCFVIMAVSLIASLLIGCTAQVQQVKTITQADLTSAIAIAQAATPPDTEGVMCFTFLSANLNTLLPSNPPTPAGLVSDFELGHVGLATLNGLNPIGNKPLEIACGPYALNVIGGLQGLLAQFGHGAVVTFR